MKTKKTVLYILLIIVVSIIFIFSQQDGKKSENVSDTFASVVIDKFAEVVDKKIDNDTKKEFIVSTRFIVRKTAHFSLYFTLGVIVYLLVICYEVKRPFLSTLLICILFASGDEFHQLFSKNRTARIYDVAIDTLGSSVGMLITYSLKKTINRIKERRSI